jgi:molybdopterin-biosynthesis enzyme MoeA-like protein
MAMIPEGATLVDAGDLWLKAVIIGNVHIFPGVPQLLRKKFESIRERFRGVPFVLRRVFVARRESDIVASLNEVVAEFPELMLGSYPRFEDRSVQTLLTLESRDGDYVQRALDALLARLPGDAVHKVE